MKHFLFLIVGAIAVTTLMRELPAPSVEPPPPPREIPPTPVFELPAPPPIKDSAHDRRTVVGRLSADPTRAQTDVRLQLKREVADWLVPDVPRSWSVPDRLIEPMIRDTKIKAYEKDYGTVYEASQTVELFSHRREQIVAAYHREVVTHRLTILGGALGFVLACLALLAGYIQADEATQGYYTNRLRLLAAAGVGVAGILIYQMLT
jgi:hypothetical protein